MTEDITPGLLKKIQNDFQKNFDKSAVISELYKKVRDGTATYQEVNEIAIKTGDILAKAFANNLSSEVLPDGKMYFNIAERVIEPTLTNNYDLVVEVAKQVQTDINKKAGIGIKAQTPNLNKDRIRGFINRVSSSDNYDEVAWILDEPVRLFSQSVVDDAIQVNAEFQYNAGLSPKIVRTSTGKCCEWCNAIAGVYDYPNIPKDVYRRHDYCRCMVDYIAGKERRNVHNGNTEKQRRYVRDQYGGYEKSKAARIAHAKQMEATEKERKAVAREKRIETWRKKKEMNKD